MDNLKDKTAKGIAWGALNNGTTQVLNLLFGIVLARCLSESDYGIIALLTIITTLAGYLQSAGFSQALANMKSPTQRDYNAVFWFNVLAGATMYVILFFASPLLAAFFRLPVLVDVARLTFVSILASALGIAPNAKLWIELRNRELAITSIVALIVSGCTGVWLAFHGYGYWSLAWQQLIFISLSTILKWYFIRWRPTLPIDFSPIRGMLRFSSKMLATNMLNVVSQNVLTLIFGKLLPIGVVGQWGQANKWNIMGSSFISATMQQVAQPVLTKAAADDSATVPAVSPQGSATVPTASPQGFQRQERVFRKMLRFTAFVSFPLMLGLALVAKEFIVLTIGAKWLPCVPMLQTLCIGGAFLPLHTLYQNFIISRGRSDLYLTCVSLMIALQVVLTLGLSPWGIMAMVVAFTTLNVVFTAVWHFALRRIHPLGTVAALLDTMPFLLVAVAVMATTYALTSWTDSLLLRLCLRILIAAILYLAAMKMLKAKTLEECMAFVVRNHH